MPKPEECASKDDVRREIDRLDRALIALLGERFGYVKRITEFKADPSEAVDGGRIEQVLDKVRSLAREQGLDPDLVASMWRSLIEWNIEYERRAIADRTSGGARP